MLLQLGRTVQLDVEGLIIPSSENVVDAGISGSYVELVKVNNLQARKYCDDLNTNGERKWSRWSREGGRVIAGCSGVSATCIVTSINCRDTAIVLLVLEGLLAVSAGIGLREVVSAMDFLC